MRRARAAVGAAVLALALSGCQADDSIGVGVAASGRPVVRNCGAYLLGVEVTDVASGRVLWSANGSTTTDRRFHDEDCGYAPAISRRTLIIAAVILGVVIAAATGINARSRRRRRTTELDV